MNTNLGIVNIPTVSHFKILGDTLDCSSLRELMMQQSRINWEVLKAPSISTWVMDKELLRSVTLSGEIFKASGHMGKQRSCRSRKTS